MLALLNLIKSVIVENRESAARKPRRDIAAEIPGTFADDKRLTRSVGDLFMANGADENYRCAGVIARTYSRPAIAIVSAAPWTMFHTSLR